MEVIVDKFRKRHEQLKQSKQLLLKKEVQKGIELNEAKKIQRACEKNF